MRTLDVKQKQFLDECCSFVRPSDAELEEMYNGRRTPISRQPEQTQEIRTQDGKDR